MFKKKRKLRYKISSGKSPRLKRSPKSIRASKRFAKKSSATSIRIKSYLKLFTATTIIVLSSYAFFFSSYFNILQITVNQEELLSTNTIIAEEIKTPIKHIIGENLLFTNTEELELEIMIQFPEIEEVSITKNYPSTLEVKFFEYPLVANIINESPSVKKSFVINSKGYAIKENVENPSLPYINIQSDEPINTSTPAIEVNKLKYILDTKTYFEDKFGMRIVEMEYKKDARELHITTEKNFIIWLDIQTPAEEQLKKLKKALVKLDIYTEPLQYIDLRIAGGNGDKIIYKRR